MADNKRGCCLPQTECAGYTEVYKAGEAAPLPAWTHCASKEAGPGQFLKTQSMGKIKREYNQIRPHSAKNYHPPAPETIITMATT